MLAINVVWFLASHSQQFNGREGAHSDFLTDNRMVKTV